MNIKKAFRFRIYPTLEQQNRLAVQFGQARFVYNHFLNVRRETYQQTGKGIYYRQTANQLTDLKKDSRFAWLKEADAQVLQQKLVMTPPRKQGGFLGLSPSPCHPRAVHQTLSVLQAKSFIRSAANRYVLKVLP